jgi:beta-galactosidase
LGLNALQRTLVGVEREGARTVVRATYAPADARQGTAADGGAGGVVVQHVQVLTSVLVPQGWGVLIEETVEIPSQLTDLPRVGTVFETVPGFTWLDWFGGPVETYPDRRAAGKVCRYAMVADGWYTPYLRPQENGGRDAVRLFELSDTVPSEDGLQRQAPARRLGVLLDEPRQVSVTRYRAADLAAATHPDGLVQQPGHVVHIDAAHRGVGTASCGPDTLPEYLVPGGTYTWSYLLA